MGAQVPRWLGSPRVSRCPEPPRVSWCWAKVLKSWCRRLGCACRLRGRTRRIGLWYGKLGRTRAEKYLMSTVSRHNDEKKNILGFRRVVMIMISKRYFLKDWWPFSNLMSKICYQWWMTHSIALVTQFNIVRPIFGTISELKKDEKLEAKNKGKHWLQSHRGSEHAASEPNGVPLHLVGDHLYVDRLRLKQGNVRSWTKIKLIRWRMLREFDVWTSKVRSWSRLETCVVFNPFSETTLQKHLGYQLI